MRATGAHGARRASLVGAIAATCLAVPAGGQATGQATGQAAGPAVGVTAAKRACLALTNDRQYAQAVPRCRAALDEVREAETGRALVGALIELEREAEARDVAAQLGDPHYLLYVLARTEEDHRYTLYYASRLLGDAQLDGAASWIAYGAFVQAGAAKELGEYALAERALGVAEAAGFDPITMQLGRVNLLRAAGDFDEALRLGEEALELAAAMPAEQAAAVKTEALVQLALVNVELGRYGLAANALRDLSLAESDPGRIDTALMNLAYVYDKLGFCGAANLYLHVARMNGEPTIEWEMQAGDVALHCGDPARAAGWLRRADDAQRAGKWHGRVLTSLGALAEHQGDLAAAGRQYAAAQAFIERMRAGGGTLAALLAGKLLEPYERAIDLAARHGDWRGALAIVLRHELGRDDPAAVEATLAAWRGRTLAIFVRGNDRVWRLHVEDQRVTGEDLGPIAPIASLDLLADDRAAREITGKLGERLPARGEVYVNLIGDLAQVPLAALRRGRERVIDQTALLRVVRIAPRPRSSPRPAGGAHVVIGDPLLPPDALGDPALATGDPTLAPDPAVARAAPGLVQAHGEAIDVAQFLGVEPQLGAAATRAVIEAARDAALLHVAGHATWTLDGPRLPLADATLGAPEIAQLAPAPRLVVLASCFSARARDRGGLTSLAAAFLDAGAAMVISTQTTVDDAAARRLVMAFYRHGGARAPADGLRRAQLELAAAGVDPHEWASFVAIAAPPER